MPTTPTTVAIMAAATAASTATRRNKFSAAFHAKYREFFAHIFSLAFRADQFFFIIGIADQGLKTFLALIALIFIHRHNFFLS